jgi:TonB family protein
MQNHIFVLSLVITASFILPVHAQDRSAYMSDCGVPGSEGLAHPYPELEQWFDSCTRRIKTVVDHEPQTQTNSMRGIMCRFSIAKNGTIYDLSFWSRSRDRAVNERALQIIRDAAPFAPLPEGVAWSNEAVFEFDGAKLDSWMVIKSPRMH